MLSREIELLLFELLISISNNEKKLNKIKSNLPYLEEYNLRKLFSILTTTNKISYKDLKNFLINNGYKYSEKLLKFFIFFYDINHDCGINYKEFLIFIKNENHINNNNEAFNFDMKEIIINLLINEINLLRIILTYLEELQNKKGFSIHEIFHALKDRKKCSITKTSIYNFIRMNKNNISKEEIGLIIKRLDINKDKIIDFSELHAFLGFPYCDYCCPCQGCNFCGAKYCKNCLGGEPCYLYGCNHINSTKMICTSNQHMPSFRYKRSNISSVKKEKRKRIISTRLQKNHKNKISIENYYDSHKSMTKKKKNESCHQLSAPSLDNIENNYYKFNRQQIQILKHIMYPNQFKNFLIVTGIIDIQKSYEKPINNNMILKDAPKRYFDPKFYTPEKNLDKKNLDKNLFLNRLTTKKSNTNNNNNQNLLEIEEKKIFPKNLSYYYSYDNTPYKSPVKASQFNNNNNINTYYNSKNNSQRNSPLLFDYKKRIYYKNPNYNEVEQFSIPNQIYINKSLDFQRRNNVIQSKSSNYISIENDINNKMNYNPYNTQVLEENNFKNSYKKRNKPKYSSKNKLKKYSRKEKDIEIEPSITSSDFNKAKKFSKREIKKQIENLKENLLGKGNLNQNNINFSLLKSTNTVYFKK